MPLQKEPLVFKNTLSGVTILALLSFFLWRAIGAFGPGAEINNVDFNSDSAIPVLMSNDQRPITIFNFYYYGADRWGGWPFLVAQLVGRAAGYRWTPESVFVLQAVWIFLGVLIFASLSRRDRLLVAVVYLIALCLHRESRYLIFELSQVYAWQTTACLLSWWTLRRLFEQHVEPAQSQRVRVWKGSVWLLLAFAFSFLAIWSSVASTLFVGFLLCLETLRAQLRRRSELSTRRLLTPFVLGLTVILSATLMERFQKMAYRRFSLRYYNNDFATYFALDTGHLAENLSRQLGFLGKLSWWPLYLLPTLALVAVAGAFVYAVV